MLRNLQNQVNLLAGAIFRYREEIAHLKHENFQIPALQGQIAALEERSSGASSNAAMIEEKYLNREKFCTLVISESTKVPLTKVEESLQNVFLNVESSRFDSSLASQFVSDLLN